MRREVDSSVSLRCDVIGSEIVKHCVQRLLKMRRASFLYILLCIFKCVSFVSAICTVASDYAGSGVRLQCTNVTLQGISEQIVDASAIIIINSDMSYITGRAFVKYSRYLRSLNIHNCRVNDIHAEAFNGLTNLKKLSLPSNNLTQVREEWFRDLAQLEQLDLSFNRITRIDGTVFHRIPLLKRLDARENLLTCLDPTTLPGGIDKVFFVGNPLSFKCRGELTLWMRDHGVRYKTEMSEKETWLDKLLWLCAIGDPRVAKSELLMKECVILSLFNQLRTGLSTAESYPLAVSCTTERNTLTNCIAAEAQKFRASTNGNVISKLLLYLHQTKSAS